MDQMLKKAKRKMKEVWGYKTFRSGQEEIISSLLKGHDVLAVMPTAFGKSLCYQLPAIMADGGVTIVVSPLIALMKDQCADANAVGINAVYLNSSLSSSEHLDRMTEIEEGNVEIVYVSPEKLSNVSFKEFLSNLKINYIAVDEAHCVSRHGHDFRPMYQRIQDFTRTLENRPPIIACTATCPIAIEDSVAEGIGLQDYTRVVTDPIRDNFSYEFVCGSMWWHIKKVAKTFDSGRHLVYTSTRRGCEILTDIVGEIIGVGAVSYYHAGLTTNDRTYIQEQFKDAKSDLRVVVATCAFGMGINIPDIRTVTHCGIPSSLEDYVQEIGRGGRDGKPVTAMLIADPKSVAIREQHIKGANPPWELVDAVWTYLTSKVLEDNEPIHISTDALASAVLKSSRVKLTTYELHAVLDALESLGALRRLKATKSRKNKFTLKMKTDRDNLMGNDKLVADYLWKPLQVHFEDGGLNCITRTTDIVKVAIDLQLDEAEVMNCMFSLETRKFIMRPISYRVDAIQITDKCKELPTIGVCRREYIARKLERDSARLLSMLDYVKASDKVSYIRKYFME